MTGCAIDQARIKAAIEFHGHWCPGLAIGLRVAELALREVGHASDEEVVAIVETDMCGVDAIQFITGCTFGKGNLLFRDHGKMAFSFYRRRDGRAIRILLKPDALGAPDPEQIALRKKRAQGSLSLDETRKMEAFRQASIEKIMQADLESLLVSTALTGPVPEKARLMDSLNCERCGESTMESRTRRFQGQILCIACFDKLEKRF